MVDHNITANVGIEIYSASDNLTLNSNGPRVASFRNLGGYGRFSDSQELGRNGAISLENILFALPRATSPWMVCSLIAALTQIHYPGHRNTLMMLVPSPYGVVDTAFDLISRKILQLIQKSPIFQVPTSNLRGIIDQISFILSTSQSFRNLSIN
ncbi:hypothetical protein ABKN59_007369 [Abortiporus biennis]